jgi:hypothetical protein
MDQQLAALPGLRGSAPTLSTEEREVLRGNPSPPSRLTAIFFYWYHRHSTGESSRSASVQSLVSESKEDPPCI